MVRRPLFVRRLSEDEQRLVTAALRAQDAFVLRRAQVLLASARGEYVQDIALRLSYDSRTVRNAIHAFNRSGLDSLTQPSSRSHTPRAALDAGAIEQLWELLHRSPRAYGRGANHWTLDLTAQVSYEQGITRTRVTGETIRATLARLGVSWQRARGLIESPDFSYLRRRLPLAG